MARTLFSRMQRTEQEIQIARPETFEDFFAEHGRSVFGAVWLVTRNSHEAEEVTQDAFLRIWERWDRVSIMEDPKAYLYVTAMNIWRSRLRRTSVALRKAVHALPADDSLEDVESRDAVVRALAPLPERQRAAIVLTDLLGLTSEQAAEAIGIRASSVRVLAKRGRERVRATMEEQP
jgi:RNA polymerase sigma-70 factor, ECF subfamily